MFYIDQLRTPSFPIGLVETESGIIARSVENDSGRWKPVVAEIIADTYWLSQTWPVTLRIRE